MIDRRKQAKDKGRLARLSGAGIVENPYSKLSTKYMVLAGFWDKGWKLEDQRINELNTER